MSPPKRKEREIEIYDENQVQKLLMAARDLDKWNYPLYHLAISTGMRQAELLGLKWEDLDWERRSLQVHRQLVKTKGVGFEFTEP